MHPLLHPLTRIPALVSDTARAPRSAPVSDTAAPASDHVSDTEQSVSDTVQVAGIAMMAGRTGGSLTSGGF